MRDYSPADSADDAEECSKAALFRRERQVGEVKAVLWFVVRLRKSARSAGDFLGFLVCRLIEYSHVNILPQITQRGMQLAALVRSKTIYPNPLLQDEENLNNDQSRSLFHGLE